MSSTRRLALIVGAIVLIGLVVAYATGGLGSLDDDDGLRLYGNVDVREVDLAFLVGGRIEEITREEGEKVEAGALIAQLETSQYSDRVSAAQGELDSAQAEFGKARSGNRIQEIKLAKANLAEAQAALDKANGDLKRRSGLVRTGAVSRQVYDATRAEQRVAAARVEAARQGLSLSQAGARKEDKASAAARVKAAAANRNSARTNLKETSLYSPVAGTVLTRAREPGAIVQAGETVITMTIDRPLRVLAYVAETDLSKIATGMAVNVTADGNSRAYKGKISQISPSAEFTPKTVQTEDLRTDLVYRVRILVDKSDGALRQGQPVTVAVQGGE